MKKIKLWGILLLMAFALSACATPHMVKCPWAMFLMPKIKPTGLTETVINTEPVPERYLFQAPILPFDLIHNQKPFTKFIYLWVSFLWYLMPQQHIFSSTFS